MSSLKIFILLFFTVTVFSGCSGLGYDEEFAEDYKEFYADELLEAEERKRSDYTIQGALKFRGEPPTKDWISLDTSEEVHPFNPTIVRLMLKRDSDRFIITSVGRQDEYGIPETMDLLDQEFAYLVKNGAGGDFVGKQEIKISNTLLKTKSFFLFDIRKESSKGPKIVKKDGKTVLVKRDPGKPIKRNLCVMIKDRNKINFFELYTTVKDYPVDIKDFIIFLESVKGPPKKDKVDLIKEKAHEH